MLYEEDVRSIATDSAISWQMIDGKKLLVTGATGLIGGLLADAVLCRNRLSGAETSLILPVRNVQKAVAYYSNADRLSILRWDAVDGCMDDVTCDLIVHCASNTDSKLMVSNPVDTICTTVNGTVSMLDLARSTRSRMVYVSSMEVYGKGSLEAIDESRGGEIDSMSVRNCYPQSKQLAETLCASYASQYQVDVCVARLAQSFGAGIKDSDRRVFAEFARSCIRGDDIHLLTDGSKSNMYVYTADAVRALLILLTNGKRGEAYNVANESTFCSVYQMAELVARDFGNCTKVERVIDEEASKRYAVSGRMYLDTAKLRKLGWVPTYGLKDMYGRMISDWQV